MSVERVDGGSSLELAVELADDVALEAAFGLAVGLVLGATPVGVGSRGWVALQADEHDGVQRRVELAVAVAAEAVAGGPPGGGGNGRGAGEPSESGFAAYPTAV